MSGERYVPIQYDAMRSLLEDEMGFTALTNLTGTFEYVWQRTVTGKSVFGKPEVAVRVYSSVDLRYGVTREVASDAIRVCLVDLTPLDREKHPLGRVLNVDKRVYRTKSALTNLRERARDVWSYGADPMKRCPKCGSIMVLREGRGGEFMGCTKYPTCRGTRQL